MQNEAKASKSEAKREKREANKKDEDDLDALLAEFRSMASKESTVREEVVPPPSPRANGTLTVHPSKDELLLRNLRELYEGGGGCWCCWCCCWSKCCCCC